MRRIIGACLMGDQQLWLSDGQQDAQIDPTNAEAWQQLLQTFGPSRVHLVLTGNQYQLLSIERPPVEADELTQALPFLVKDLTSIAPEHLQLDHFQLAVQPADSNTLQVVAADRRRLVSMVEPAFQAGFQLDFITIEELALLDLLPSHSRPHLMLWHLPGQPLKLSLALDGQLLLSRNIRGFNQLDLLSEEELRQGLFDALLLELQRSLDYLERQLRQQPVAGLTLVLPLRQQQCLAERLGQELGLPVQALVDADRGPYQVLAHAAAMARGNDENTD